MDRFSSFVVRRKKPIMILFIVAALIGVLLQLGVRINYNLVEYLPKDAPSTIALDVMGDEFQGAIPNARIMLRDVSVQEALDYKERLGAIDGVSDIMWLDDVVDLKVPLEMADKALVENYYKDGNALLTFTIRAGDEVAVTDAIYALIGDAHALSGDAPDRAAIQKLAGSETLRAMIILVPVIILILLISTHSWVEPILFLGAIGVSVFINMGTNLILGEVSFITSSVSPILQLAVSLDYAIFLLHSFADARTETNDVDVAMKRAMKRALPSVTASAATTLFGFLALVFMKFRIGSDLGLNLVKGIVFSFISVMVFLPALTLCCYKLIDRTQHRYIFPSFKKAGKVIARAKAPILILIALLLIPSFLAQRSNDFIYGMGALNTEDRIGQDAVATNEVFGASNIVVLMVPKGEVAREYALGEELLELDHVTAVVSYASMVGPVIPDAYLDSGITSQFYSEHYARIMVYTDMPEEGEVSFAVVERIRAVTQQYYGDSYYSLGQSANLYDMKEVVTWDNTMVNTFAVIAIVAVLMFTFKSISLPLLLTLTIETAIWINLSVPYFMGSPLCYIGYLVVSTVQLGATVDYAILLTDHYMKNRARMPAAAALDKTMGETFGSILISATILSVAGFCLFLSSSNAIVSEMGILLGRGTLLSMLLVVVFLPNALVLFDRVIEKTTWRSKFFKEKSS